MSRSHALVTGATGLAGRALVQELVEHGWPVVATSRSPQPPLAGVSWIQVDLLDRSAVERALGPHTITHVFHAAQMPPPDPIAGPPWLLRVGTALGGATLRLTGRWNRARKSLYRALAVSTGMHDPAQNNLAMLRNVTEVAQSRSPGLTHVVVVTGGRHYGMHLGPRLYPAYQSHYIEDETPRCPEPNWYYDLEDHLRDHAGTGGWTWTVLRPSFLLGTLRNGQHNLGTALGAYVALTSAMSLPLDFLGDKRSASIETDLTCANQLAQVARWTVDTPAAADQAFNVATGMPFSWSALWPAFVTAQGRTGRVTSKGVRLTRLVKDHQSAWRGLAQRHSLAEADLKVLASPGYADQMMLLDWDATFDVGKLKRAGFGYFPTPLQVLNDLVKTMEEQQLIPPQAAR